MSDPKQGKRLESELKAMSEQQRADEMVMQTILQPVWACDVCKRETPIEGLEAWPEYEPEKEPEKPTEVVAKRWKHCPHCGETLDN